MNEHESRAVRVYERIVNQLKSAEEFIARGCETVFVSGGSSVLPSGEVEPVKMEWKQFREVLLMVLSDVPPVTPEEAQRICREAKARRERQAIG